MANQTVKSTTITFLDYTDSRKLEVYISSNHPTVQIYNPNNKTYSPDWSKEKLRLENDLKALESIELKISDSEKMLDILLSA